MCCLPSELMEPLLSSVRGGSGCCGNMDAGIGPPNTGNTEVGTGGRWANIADMTLWPGGGGGGLAWTVGLLRSCGVLEDGGLDIEANLNRCSVKELF